MEFVTSVVDNVVVQVPNHVNYCRNEPIGVAGLISPWNLPLYLLTWKIAPAIAVGNTCVCKPSEITSMTAFLLCQVMKEVRQDVTGAYSRLFMSVTKCRWEYQTELSI